ncbi:hypothetical protein AQV86_04330 [Nanohaloarchaea archaeon SG9]|nr:hypothetical protein AQV86_04330 [Nanohaloarchaea archaeon SG9]
MAEIVYGIKVEADYGHFRKNFSTSSPLTHGVPPRTAVAGLLGAIFGLPRKGENSYQEVFSQENSDIAVLNQPREETEKQTININLLKMKDETERIIKLGIPPEKLEKNQVPFEMIRKPQYVIYFRSNKLESPENVLEEEKSFYTPYLGISENIARYEYIGKQELEEKEGEADIDSVIPLENSSVQFEEGKKYAKESVSMFMNQEREVQKFSDIMYVETLKSQNNDTEEDNDYSVHQNEGQYYQLENGHKIKFLE